MKTLKLLFYGIIILFIGSVSAQSSRSISSVAWNEDGSIFAVGYGGMNGGKDDLCEAVGSVEFFFSATNPTILSSGLRCAIQNIDFINGTNYVLIHDSHTYAWNLSDLSQRTGVIINAQLYGAYINRNGDRLAYNVYQESIYVNNISKNPFGFGLSNTILRTGNEGDVVTDASWSPEDFRIANSSMDGTIRIWDSEEDALLQEIDSDLSLAKTSVSWSNNNNVIAFGDVEGGVTLWNLDTNVSIFHFSGHTDKINELVWSPDGTRLASASQDGTVKVWDAQHGVLLKSFTYPGPVYALDWHPDGSEIAYGGLDLSGAEPQVVQTEAPVIPTPTNTPVPPTPTFTPVPPTDTPTITPSFTPTNTYTPTPTDTPTPSHTPTDTPTITPVPPTPVPGMGWIAFTSNRAAAGQRSIYAARPLDTNAVRITTDANVVDTAPVWSPDRSLIAFVREDSTGNRDIYIKRVGDNSTLYPLGGLVNTATSDENQVTWSPDGTKLAFNSNRDGDSDIYTVNIAPSTSDPSGFVVSGRQNLTDANTGYDRFPHWSDWGITYASDSDGNLEVYTIQPDVTGRKRVSTSTVRNGITVDNTQPRWSPDGKYIAYTTNYQDGLDLDIYIAEYRQNVTTGVWSWVTVRNLTIARTGDDEFVSWDPQYPVSLGYRFAFTSNNDILIMTIDTALQPNPPDPTPMPTPPNLPPSIVRPLWNTASLEEKSDW